MMIVYTLTILYSYSEPDISVFATREARDAAFIDEARVRFEEDDDSDTVDWSDPDAIEEYWDERCGNGFETAAYRDSHEVIG